LREDHGRALALTQTPTQTEVASDDDGRARPGIGLDNVRYYIDAYSIEQEENEAEDAIGRSWTNSPASPTGPAPCNAPRRSQARLRAARAGRRTSMTPAEVHACYQQAMLTTAADEAARARVTAIKASYDA